MLLIATMTMVFTFTHIFISRYIHVQNIPFLQIGQFRFIHFAVTIVNIILTFIMVKVIYEMWTNSFFEILPVIVALFLSYILGIIMTGYLAYKFLTWYRANHGKTIILYFFSSALITTTAFFTLTFLYSVLSMYTMVIPRFGGTVFYISYLQHTVLSITNLLATLSFISTWVATTVLLKYRSSIIGRTKFWIIAVLPLVYFLTQFLSLITNGFSFVFENDPIFFGIVLTLLFTYSKFVGGILFGLAFWTMAKSIAMELDVPKNFIRMAGYGYVILFLSTQTVAFAIVPYPPFGLITILFYGIGSYMILVGVYFSVIIISKDSKMRSLIRKATERNPSLIADMSYAQLENVIEKTTAKLVKNLVVEPASSLSTEESNLDEIKSYALSVMSEIEKSNPNYVVVIDKQRDLIANADLALVHLEGKLLRLFKDHCTDLLLSINDNNGREIRIITSVNVSTLSVVKGLIKMNLSVRHNTLASTNNFIVTDKKLFVIPENWEYTGQKSEIISDTNLVKQYKSMFEDLWEKSMASNEEINKIESNSD